MIQEFSASVKVVDRAEPLWHSKVDRWYQLDEVGFACCEALSQWPNLPRPNLLILAMTGGATVADQDFVATGAESPAKFVFTLPNICAAALCQLLGIHLQVYCVNSENSPQFARETAEKLLVKYQSIWLLESSPRLDDQSRTVNLTTLRS